MSTVTTTYTESDIRTVYSRLHADLQMIAESTGLWTQEHAESIVYDLTILAILGYISKIGVYLLAWNGAVLQAEEYKPSTDASTWTTQRPSCRWPRVPYSRLQLIVSYTSTYAALTATELAQLKSQLRIAWTAATFRPDLSALSAAEERTYASNGYGLRRVSYR